jgi:hypothetical protein
MFAIQLLPASQLGPDGQRLGKIVVGDFQERFACHSEDITGLERHWRKQLVALVNHAPVVALRHDPRFAWIIYGEGDTCFVRQRFSLDGDFTTLPLRADDEAVSEWTTTIASVVEFLGSCSPETDL